MPDLPQKKVGLISCSGEDHPLGTVARVATRLVLEKLRPNDTVTLCLPLFLAGEESERAFARFYPTIAIDGCGVACAARATAQHSGPVVRALDLEKLLAGLGIAVQPSWRRRLDAAGMAAAEEVAAIVARVVDHILGQDGRPAEAASAEEAAGGEVAACSCGSGIPVLRLEVAGRTMELLGVPAILDQFRQEGRAPAPETTAALLAQTRLYNAIAAEDAAALAEALDAAYREQWGHRQKVRQ
jgi:uncharacterized metal-binding protein